MKTFLIRGVPHAMQQDGWWLNPPIPENGHDKTPSRAPVPRQILVLLGLVALGDVLMWGVVPGLSLAIFGGAVVALSAYLFPQKISRRAVALAADITALAVLPLVELVQPLSLVFFFVGLPLALAVLSGRPFGGSFRYWWAGPLHTVRDLFGTLTQEPVMRPKTNLLQNLALAWGLPVGVGLIFTALLVDANPVLDRWLSDLVQLQIDLPDMTRVFLWAGLAVLVWPALSLVRFAPRLSPDAKPARFGPKRMPRLVNAASISRSLVLFNGLFLLQNGLDVAFLMGGADLPDGLSYAKYAHQGAYPLVLLALLSGGFALLARPFITAAPILQTLLLIWICQTIWLTVSSGLRLQLYVGVYGLTHLRLAAGIWMALVASGLGLIFWQCLTGKQTSWMLRRIALIGVGAVYFCCFVSFDKTIARYNLTHNVQTDRHYICTLGESAAPEILRHTGQMPRRFCDYQWPIVSTPQDWREWGFRNARVRRTFAKLNNQSQTQ